ncbi:SdpI family protein [Cellulosimicrobium protaetiae]|uniref:SdpI family protein n=1 Tax=Cellulosimicrobium protaetiae TaxID=2587808 RepID=A0A6M5UA78_9MICO|nr:SdpI family protein [Cellulosimicrobium protaetiae]QJW35120.1 SdpI family protein [Cellulosimicrobium protaetiae]
MTADTIADVALLLVLAGAGILLVWCARATASGRIGRNQLAGIRTATTLASDEAWRTAHRAARPLSEAAGWVLVAASPVLFLVDAEVGLVVVLVATGLTLALTVGGLVVGTRAVRREVRR